jgi:hypothetical protein
MIAGIFGHIGMQLEHCRKQIAKASKMEMESVLNENGICAQTCCKFSGE